RGRPAARRDDGTAAGRDRVAARRRRDAEPDAAHRAAAAGPAVRLAAVTGTRPLAACGLVVQSRKRPGPAATTPSRPAPPPYTTPGTRPGRSPAACSDPYSWGSHRGFSGGIPYAPTYHVRAGAAGPRLGRLRPRRAGPVGQGPGGTAAGQHAGLRRAAPAG